MKLYFLHTLHWWFKRYCWHGMGHLNHLRH